ncbi:MAG: TetR/AcrR family transcriptional regulator [Novosphingobium sp.]|nr:TetR/AcrR family transcriptional regulator [Novosphingobium sp.]MCP5403819.1 TetR/AcrR family transcriptional regulator [Novosphingobium sp.]
MIVPSAPQNRLRRPDDPRALKSRRALRDALLALLEKRTFEQITIKEITSAAGVSYPVFFRQFASKEELLNDLAASEVGGLLALTHPIVDEAVAMNNLREMCNYVQQRRPLWKSLLTTGAASTMRSEFARISAEIAKAGPQANPWLPVELASSFVATGIFEILAWWLNQPEDYPVGNIVKILHALIARPLSLPQNVQLD